jgi:hypothetical protein
LIAQWNSPIGHPRWEIDSSCCAPSTKRVLHYFQAPFTLDDRLRRRSHDPRGRIFGTIVWHELVGRIGQTEEGINLVTKFGGVDIARMVQKVESKAGPCQVDLLVVTNWTSGRVLRSVSSCAMCSSSTLMSPWSLRIMDTANSSNCISLRTDLDVGISPFCPDEEETGGGPRELPFDARNSIGLSLPYSACVYDDWSAAPNCHKHEDKRRKSQTTDN